MKKHFYSIFALFLVGAIFSCQSPKSNSAKEENDDAYSEGFLL